MRVLLIGSGGREHALYWKLSQSSKLSKIFVSPGNGGFPAEVMIPQMQNFDSMRAFVQKEKIDLVVVGPEQPLVDGIVDNLSDIVPVFGPNKFCAQLEGSKDFSKGFMKKYGIPTADAVTFTNSKNAIEYLHTRSLPIVIKADGLAAGKGVTVATTFADAENAICDSLDKGVFGASGRSLLIEDFLQGEEASVFALCDGKRALAMIAAQDHKRVFDNDEGPNTGGMGAYSPVKFMTADVMAKVEEKVLKPVMRGMIDESSPYRGLLYAGLMIHNGIPSVVEFNCRFGDPETQALLRLLDEDLLELCLASAKGELPDRPLKFRSESAISVVLAAQGYPGDYSKNIPLDAAKNLDGQRDIIIFHAGTGRDPSGRVASTGGRVLSLTAIGKDLQEARKVAYEALQKVSLPGLFYRKDIGKKGI